MPNGLGQNWQILTRRSKAAEAVRCARAIRILAPLSALPNLYLLCQFAALRDVLEFAASETRAQRITLEVCAIGRHLLSSGEARMEIEKVAAAFLPTQDPEHPCEGEAQNSPDAVRALIRVKTALVHASVGRVVVDTKRHQVDKITCIDTSRLLDSTERGTKLEVPKYIHSIPSEVVGAPPIGEEMFLSGSEPLLATLLSYGRHLAIGSDSLPRELVEPPEKLDDHVVILLVDKWLQSAIRRKHENAIRNDISKWEKHAHFLTYAPALDPPASLGARTSPVYVTNPMSVLEATAQDVDVSPTEALKAGLYLVGLMERLPQFARSHRNRLPYGTINNARSLLRERAKSSKRTDIGDDYPFVVAVWDTADPGRGSTNALSLLTTALEVIQWGFAELENETLEHLTMII